MRVSILYFSILQKITCKRSESLELQAGVNGDDLFKQLIARYPEFASYKKYLRLAINQEYRPWNTPLEHNDEVALISPVSGG